MNFSPPVRRVLALLLLLLLAAIGWRLALAPAWQAWQADAQALSEQRDALARLRALAASRARYEAALAEADRTFDVSEGLMAAPSGTLAAADLQQQVKALVEQAGGMLLSVQPIDAQQAGPFARIGLNVRIVTSTDALQQVLHALESSVPIVVIDELLILARTATRGARRGEAGAHELDVRLQLAGYVSSAEAPEPP